MVVRVEFNIGICMLMVLGVVGLRDYGVLRRLQF